MTGKDAMADTPPKTPDMRYHTAPTQDDFGTAAGTDVLDANTDADAERGLLEDANVSPGFGRSSPSVEHNGRLSRVQGTGFSFMDGPPSPIKGPLPPPADGYVQHYEPGATAPPAARRTGRGESIGGLHEYETAPDGTHGVKTEGAPHEMHPMLRAFYHGQLAQTAVFGISWSLLSPIYIALLGNSGVGQTRVAYNIAICLVSPIVGGWAQSSNVRATLVGTSLLRAVTYALAVPALWVVFRSGWWGFEEQVRQSPRVRACGVCMGFCARFGIFLVAERYVGLAVSDADSAHCTLSASLGSWSRPSSS